MVLKTTKVKINVLMVETDFRIIQGDVSGEDKINAKVEAVCSLGGHYNESQESSLKIC
jgi:hypothetical protein